MRNFITIIGLFVALSATDLTIQAIAVVVVLLINIGEYKDDVYPR